MTRNPTAGSTGVASVASAVPCTPAYPADDRAAAVWALATTERKFVLYCEQTAVRDGDIVTVGGDSYQVKGKQAWHARGSRLAFDALLIEKQR